VVPALDGGEHARAPADIAADVRFAPGAGAIAEVLALHVDAVERVGGGSQADGVNIIQGHLAGIESHFRRLKGKLFTRLLGAAHKPGHPGSYHGNFSFSHGLSPL